MELAKPSGMFLEDIRPEDGNWCFAKSGHVSWESFRIRAELWKRELAMNLIGAKKNY